MVKNSSMNVMIGNKRDTLSSHKYLAGSFKICRSLLLKTLHKAPLFSLAYSYTYPKHLLPKKIVSKTFINVSLATQEQML